MEYFIKFPYRKYVSKKVSIVDVSDRQVGFVQRKYKNIWERLLHSVPIYVLHKKNIYGESDGRHIKIFQQPSQGLKQLKWDVSVNDGDPFLLENQTKERTNMRMVYHKNNQSYVFEKEAFHKTCSIYVEGKQTPFAEISLERAPAYFKVKVKKHELTLLELMAIYYVMYLVYL